MTVKYPKSLKKVDLSLLTTYQKRLKKIKAEVPKWLKAIPESSAHGSGTYEKRLWRITSDYVRIRDAYKWKYTVDGKYILNWRETHAGHYISYTLCNNLFKFHPMNIHAQGAKSNLLSSAHEGKMYADELVRRYGKGYLKKIDKENQSNKLYYYSSKGVHDDDVITMIKDRLDDFKELEEMPDYVKRAISLLES